MKYEYDVKQYEAEPLLGDDLATTLTKAMNERGKQGWEPIFVNMIDKAYVAWVTFRRVA